MSLASVIMSISHVAKHVA